MRISLSRPSTWTIGFFSPDDAGSKSQKFSADYLTFGLQLLIGSRLL